MENPQTFLNAFLDSDSPLFMSTDLNRIYNEAKRSATLFPATYQSIKDHQIQQTKRAKSIIWTKEEN